MARAADLSSDLVQRIGSFLDLRSRARASCACKLWLAALPSAPIERLKLDFHRSYGVSRMQWTWLCTHRPPIKMLEVAYVPFPAEQAGAAIRALFSACLKDTKVLIYNCYEPPLNAVLPDICSAAPRLEVLQAPDNVGHRWVYSVSCLGHLSELKDLELEVSIDHKGQEFRLPCLANLTALKLTMATVTGPYQLGGEQLPSLCQLTVTTFYNPVVLSPKAPGFPQLRELALRTKGGGTATLDFGSMPVLQAAKFEVSELEGWVSIANASPRLSSMSCSGIGADMPWLEGLLWALPQSVRGLELRGCWGQGVRDALSQATQLQALRIESDRAGSAANWHPPQDAPLWAGLRALDWKDKTQPAGMAGMLPEGLHAASCLEILQLRIGRFHPADMDSVQHLPALKQLYLNKWFLELSQVPELRKALPRVNITFGWLGRRDEFATLDLEYYNFVEPALAALG